MKKLISVAIIAIIIGGVFNWLTTPRIIPDPVPELIDDAIGKIDNIIEEIIDVASQDIVQQREEVVREVVVYRDSVRRSVAAMSPDDLLVSFDNFIREWRKRP